MYGLVPSTIKLLFCGTALMSDRILATAYVYLWVLLPKRCVRSGRESTDGCWRLFWVGYNQEWPECNELPEGVNGSLCHWYPGSRCPQYLVFMAVMGRSVLGMFPFGRIHGIQATWKSSSWHSPLKVGVTMGENTPWPLSWTGNRTWGNARVLSAAELCSFLFFYCF